MTTTKQTLLDAALKIIRIMYHKNPAWPPIPAGERKPNSSFWGRPRPRLNILGHFSMFIDFARTLSNKDQLCIHALYPELSEDDWILQAYRSGLFPRHKTSLEQSLKMVRKHVLARQIELLIQFAQYPPFKNLPEQQKLIH